MYMNVFRAAKEVQKGISKQKDEEEEGEEIRKGVVEGKTSMHMYILLSF